MTKVAAIFPGQGSQYVGMGKAFYDAFPKARDIFAQAELICNLPISRLCFEGPLEELSLTNNLQPALVTVDLVCWLALIQSGIEPIVVAGHSLGEYPALVAAGAFSIADCLKLISLRSRLMDRDSKINPGSMCAIIGLTPQQVTALCTKIEGIIQPANYNTPIQTVISGSSEAVAKAIALAIKQGAKAVPLKVSGAWHSPLMQKASEEMCQAISMTKFNPLTRIYIPNTTGQPTNNTQIAKSELMKQLTSPVYWTQTVKTLWGMNIDAFCEIGPKNILAGLIKKNIPKNVKIYNIENYANLKTALTELT